MSDNPQPNPTRAGDLFLIVLVSTVNKGVFNVSVTLNVGGLVVTGMLASLREYCEGMGQLFASATTDEDSQREWRKTFIDVADQAEKTLDKVPPTFIHLRDARILMGNEKSIPSNQGVWWRGRLDSVDGWFLGHIDAG